MSKNHETVTVVDDPAQDGILKDLFGFDTADPSYDWVSELAENVPNKNYKGKTETKIGDYTPDEFARALIKEAAKSPKHVVMTMLFEGKAFNLDGGIKLDSVSKRIYRQLTDAEKRSKDTLLNKTSLECTPILAGTKMASGKVVPLNCIRIKYALTVDQKQALGLIGETVPAPVAK